MLMSGCFVTIFCGVAWHWWGGGWLAGSWIFQKLKFKNYGGFAGDISGVAGVKKAGSSCGSRRVFVVAHQSLMRVFQVARSDAQCSHSLSLAS